MKWILTKRKLRTRKRKQQSNHGGSLKHCRQRSIACIKSCLYSSADQREKLMVATSPPPPPTHTHTHTLHIPRLHTVIFFLGGWGGGGGGGDTNVPVTCTCTCMYMQLYTQHSIKILIRLLQDFWGPCMHDCVTA